MPRRAPHPLRCPECQEWMTRTCVECGLCEDCCECPDFDVNFPEEDDEEDSEDAAASIFERDDG
jgi:hypothetical protein